MSGRCIQSLWKFPENSFLGRPLNTSLLSKVYCNSVQLFTTNLLNFVHKSAVSRQLLCFASAIVQRSSAPWQKQFLQIRLDRTNVLGHRRRFQAGVSSYY